MGRLPTNPRLRAVRGGDPPQPEGVLVAPDWLSGAGREEWDRLTAILVPMGLATPADRDALATLCEAVADFRWASGDIAEHGHTATTRTGFECQRPAVSIRKTAADTVAKLAARFGLTPVDRFRMGARPPEGEDSLTRLQREKAVEHRRAGRKGGGGS